jgi:hypothetical protein
MTQVSYDVELQPGEILQLPESVAKRVGPGRWRIIIESIEEEKTPSSIRGHSAFLAVNSGLPTSRSLTEADRSGVVASAFHLLGSQCRCQPPPRTGAWPLSSKVLHSRLH